MYTDRQSNLLIHQSSPYLLQHAYNPVQWYPWSEAALEKARLENKPLLISIGYSACHWCHVMERECFEDDETAQIMNRYFVCIKVDREERPDIDQLYMAAVHLMGHRGGWPLNCFALPNGQPIYGGTYFPKKNWQNILHQIHKLYSESLDEVLDYAQRITQGIRHTELFKIPEKPGVFEKEGIHSAVKNWMPEWDTEWG
ncbi:MAG: thioredoxin domain-containing protein, partial [Bacteroidia bacterium]